MYAQGTDYTALLDSGTAPKPATYDHTARREPRPPGITKGHSEWPPGDQRRCFFQQSAKNHRSPGTLMKCQLKEVSRMLTRSGEIRQDQVRPLHVDDVADRDSQPTEQWAGGTLAAYRRACG